MSKTKFSQLTDKDRDKQSLNNSSYILLICLQNMNEVYEQGIKIGNYDIMFEF